MIFWKAGLSTNEVGKMKSLKALSLGILVALHIWSCGGDCEVEGLSHLKESQRLGAWMYFLGKAGFPNAATKEYKASAFSEHL